MVIKCLGSLAFYWQRKKHREPGFLHQPSVKLWFPLCSAGHWLKPFLRQEGQGAEVKGQWRAGPSCVSQPLSCSLLPASWAFATSFWAKQWHNFIPGCFFFFSANTVLLSFKLKGMLHGTHMLSTLMTNRRSVSGWLNIPSSALIFWPSAASLIPSYAQTE